MILLYFLSVPLNYTFNLVQLKCHCDAYYLTMIVGITSTTYFVCPHIVHVQSSCYSITIPSGQLSVPHSIVF